MILIVAEKPSVARSLASVLGVKGKKDGYLEGNGYWITWAYGHLITLKEPKELDERYKYWRLEDLPIVPASLKFKIIEKKQFGVIRQLALKASQIINACDAAREGELIFRLIHLVSGVKNIPVKRLWLNSQTDEAIKKAFKNLKPSAQYDNLYKCARSRMFADWLIGMNATRAFTVKFGGKGNVLSVGRVQTPTLAFVVQRAEEIENFVPQTFWELFIDTQYGEFKWFDEDGDRILKQTHLEELKQKLEPTAKVTKVQRKVEKKNPPLLYDLTSLQREASKAFGLTPKKSLGILQKLYEEKKVLTYPRTDCPYISSDINILELFQTIQKSNRHVDIEAGSLNLKSKAVNNKKITDHHAIIPTEVVPKGVTPDETKIYDMVARRFVSAFLSPKKTQILKVEAVSGGETFKARYQKVLDPGFTILWKDDTVKKNTSQLPTIKENEILEINKVRDKEGTTTPPEYLTEDTLLGLMERCGKLVDDKELKDVLNKAKGIGTPATRAEIIEKLFRLNYMVKEGKKIKPTQKGRNLMKLLADDPLKDPTFVAGWEQKLSQIEKGELVERDFIDEIKLYIQELITKLEKTDGKRLSDGKDSFGKCLKCGAPLIETKRSFSCPNWNHPQKKCDFSIFKVIGGKTLTPNQVNTLLKKRRTAILKGFKSKKTGKKYQARLILDENLKVKFEFE